MSYLALFPALAEDLPVVAVAGVLQAEQAPVAQPRVGGVWIQDAQAHHPLPPWHHGCLAALGRPSCRPPPLCLFGLHH